MSTPCYYCELPSDDACDVCIHGKADADDLTANARDAARYRWLRQQHWAKAALCVVTNPKDAVKLGRDCPSLDRLDAAIDAAMSTTPSEKDGGKE